MKFAIKLYKYDNQLFDAWVYAEDKVQLFDSLDKANQVLISLSERNPKGIYVSCLYIQDENL